MTPDAALELLFGGVLIAVVVLMIMIAMRS